MTKVFWFLLLAALPSPVMACDCITLDPKFPNFTADLDRIAAYYPVAAEGVLEADGPHVWQFRPTHELRGPGKSSYRIELISDCSLGPDELARLVGKPVFLLLAGTNDRYEISRCVNLLGTAVDQAIRERISGGCKPR